MLADCVAFYGYGGEIVPFLGFGKATSGAGFADPSSRTPRALELMGPVETWLVRSSVRPSVRPSIQSMISRRTNGSKTPLNSKERRQLLYLSLIHI